MTPEQQFGSLIAVLVVAICSVLCIIISFALLRSIRHTSPELHKRGYNNAIRLAVLGIAVFCINVYESSHDLLYLYDETRYTKQEADACANAAVAQNFIIPLMFCAVQRQFARYYSISQKIEKATIVANSTFKARAAQPAIKQSRISTHQIFLLIELTAVIFAVIWTLTYERNYATQTECLAAQLVALPAIVAVFVNIVCSGIFAIKLRNLKDDFGMRRECIVYFFAIILVIVMVLTLDQTDWIHAHQVDMIADSPALIAVYFALIAPYMRHCGFSIKFSQNFYRPISQQEKQLEFTRRKLLAPEQTNSPAYMVSILKDHHVWTAFQMIGQRQCCPELLLFRQSLDELRLETGTLQQELLYNLYLIFIRRGADFELNLVANTYETLRVKAEDHSLCLSDFDSAYAEVTTLLFGNIYPLYLKISASKAATCGKIDSAA